MPDSTISALTAAAVLDGTEAIPVAQLTSTVRTTTQAIANLASATSAKINTVSNTLSNLISLHDILSNRVSANSAVGGTPVVSAASAATSVQGLQSVVNQLSNHLSVLSQAVSVVEVHASAASAAATSADAHANAASAAATSVDTRVNTVSNLVSQNIVSIAALSNLISGVSAKSVGVSVKGLQSALGALSNTISTVSAAVTSVDSRVNTVSNTVSQHTVSLAQLSNATSLLNAVSAKSAATSVKGLQSVVNQLSNRISAIVGGAGITSDQASAMIHSVLSTEYSARTSVGGATSIKGLQSVIDTFSVELVNEVSIRAASVQTASAAATSVDTRVNTVSNLVSQHTVSLAQLSNAVSLLNNVSTASAATSVKGLQSVIVQISNRLSAISAAATSVDTRVNTVSNTVSQHTVSLAALSNTVSAVSAAVTSVDTRLNTVSNTVSQNVVSLAALSNAVSLLNNVSAVSAATSVKGLQSVINQMSNRISAIVLGGGGMTSDQASAMIHSVLTTQYSARTSIGGATSTKGLQSALDNLSLQISSLNSVMSNALSAGDAITSALGAVSCVSAAGVAIGLQSVINAISNRLSVLSNSISAVSCVSAAGVAIGLQSVVNAVSASLVSLEVHASAASAAATSVDARVTSVNNLWTSGLGTNVVLGKCTNGHAMTPGASFTNVSGCAVALVANGDYQIDGRVFFSLSIVTGTRFGFSYNTTGNGQMVKGAMDMRCATSVIAAAISNMVSTNWSYGHINEAAMSNAATANISITGISATTYMLEIEGMLQNGNSAVTLNLQAAHSAAGGGINILAGSFIRAYRIV